MLVFLKLRLLPFSQFKWTRGQMFTALFQGLLLKMKDVKPNEILKVHISQIAKEKKVNLSI